MEKTPFRGGQEGIRAEMFCVKSSDHRRLRETTWHGDNELRGSGNVSLFPTVSLEPLAVLG